MAQINSTATDLTKKDSNAGLKMYGKYAICALLIIFGVATANSAIEWVGIVLGITLVYVDTFPNIKKVS